MSGKSQDRFGGSSSANKQHVAPFNSAQQNASSFNAGPSAGGQDGFKERFGGGNQQQHHQGGSGSKYDALDKPGFGRYQSTSSNH